MNNAFVFYIISDAMHLVYSFIGYNYLFGETHSRFFNSNDLSVANTIRYYRHVYGRFSNFKDYISSLSS